ncbi:MAG: STAS domain-containing protein [Synechococcaceae cyanobacterium RM1_1_27]|nr:STAS domain-containing protein [Synechococcaceae cyanobacterium RM1_1_27]
MRTQLLDILAGQNGSFASVILDLSQITFVDSIGMSVLIALLRFCNESSLNLKLVGVQPQAKPTFDILEMTQVFEFFGTIGDAIGAAEQK